MANYATHIGAGTVVSGALATLTLAADVVSPENLVAVTLACVLGSVLPDIDLRDSRASRLLFSSMAVFVSFCVLFVAAPKYSIVELWIVWLGTLVFVRYGLQALFHRISVHRGIWHSLLAAVFWAALTAIVFKYVMDRHEGVAWLAGGFMFIGYLTHLVLDEIFSVDFMGRRIKASFGSALKFFDAKHPGHSAGMAIATVLALVMTPSTTAFVEGISSRDLWAGLHSRFLPDDKWFGIIGKGGEITLGPDRGAGDAAGEAGEAGEASERDVTAVPDEESPNAPVTTGSIPRRDDGESEGVEGAAPVE